MSKPARLDPQVKLQRAAQRVADNRAVKKEAAVHGRYGARSQGRIDCEDCGRLLPSCNCPIPELPHEPGLDDDWEDLLSFDASAPPIVWKPRKRSESFDDGWGKDS